MAYVLIKYAISPRAKTWVLERSVDGETWLPWQYFARDVNGCQQFGLELTRGSEYQHDSDVICTNQVIGSGSGFMNPNCNSKFFCIEMLAITVKNLRVRKPSLSFLTQNFLIQIWWISELFTQNSKSTNFWVSFSHWKMLRQQARVWPIIFDFKKEVEKTWKKN